MDIIKKIAEELQIRPDQVQAVVNLIDEGNTIPFIARYRKEAHGALNDDRWICASFPQQACRFRKPCLRQNA